MSFTTGLLVLVIVLIVAAVIKWRGASGEQRAGEGRSHPSQQRSQYHAVSLKLSSGACNAAKALEGERFLSDAAPRIPLADCDAESCDCRFVHHKDRRSGEDRRYPLVQLFGSGPEFGQNGEERRTRRERRSNPPDDMS